LGSYSVDFMILACNISIGLMGVTNGQTDRRTDAQVMAKMRKA